MNRLLLRYGYPLTVGMLALFAWVVSRRIALGWAAAVPLVVAAVVVWALATPALLVLWPRITVGGFRRAILKRGLGAGPIPVNTLQAAATTASPSVPGAGLLATGSGDLLYLAGWLDLRKGPQVLHTPDMAGRYYGLQLTDPSDGANFAYVGTRATGTAAHDFLLSGPGWDGGVPDGMTPIRSPSASVLVLGRVLVESDGDLPAASALAQQIGLQPLAG